MKPKKRNQPFKPENLPPEFRAQFAQMLTAIGPSQSSNKLRNQLLMAGLSESTKGPTCQS